MLIDGRPRLACDAKLSDSKKGRVRIEPLRKFPIVADLMVDRQVIFDDLRQMQVWAEKEFLADDRSNPVMYEASRCLQCGCCLEVCPNWSLENSFAGMAAAVPMTRVLTAMDKEERKEIGELYRSYVFEGCGKSLACRNICPAGIDIDRMLVNSNAAAVWKRVFHKTK